MFAPWLLISRASFLWRGQNNVLSACASPAQCDRNLSQLEDQNWCLCGYLTNQALNAKEAGRCSKSVVHYPAAIFGRRGRERERERDIHTYNYTYVQVHRNIHKWSYQPKTLIPMPTLDSCPIAAGKTSTSNQIVEMIGRSQQTNIPNQLAWACQHFAISTTFQSSKHTNDLLLNWRPTTYINVGLRKQKIYYATKLYGQVDI